MPLTARDVARHLRFAWLEYEDHEDAITFERAFSSGVLGWRNLFMDLAPNGSAGVVDVSNQTPLLDISYLSKKTNAAERALIARPNDAHSAFLEQWIVNPGVNVQNHTLTFGSDATDQADLLVISGHGNVAKISGHAVPNAGIPPKRTTDANTIEVAKGFKRNAGQPTSGRLKYLILPSCGNAGFPYAALWVPALTKALPIHGILGYSQAYPGGPDGAALMNNLAIVMRRQPDLPILQAWSLANANFGWGAVMLKKAAEEDTMLKWVSKDGLPDLPAGLEVRQYDRSNMPTGIPIDNQVPPFEAKFNMPVSGVDTEINVTNNDLISSPELGLIPGQPGSLTLIANGANVFAPQSKMVVLFYYYREQRPDMDLDALLQFNLTPSQQSRFRKLRDANCRKLGGLGRVDGIEYTFDSTESKVARLPYTVLPQARTVFLDRSFPRSRGRVVLDVFPPGVVPPSTSAAPEPAGVVHMHLHGAYIRP